MCHLLRLFFTVMKNFIHPDTPNFLPKIVNLPQRPVFKNYLTRSPLSKSTGLLITISCDRDPELSFVVDMVPERSGLKGKSGVIPALSP